MVVGFAVPEDKKLASYRYRCAIPMERLQRMGVQCHLGIGDVTVVSKHWLPIEQVERIDGPIIFDLCDDHFNGPFDQYYRRVIDLADKITCSTPRLAERIATETGATAIVITDPYEFPKSTPQILSGTVKNVLWYGHSSNLNAVRKELPKLGKYNLRLISDAPGCHPWSPHEMQVGFTWCDAVIIPVEQKEKKMAKSPNRMVEAIRSGRYVVASPMPSYEGYGMWQGDIAEGLEWVSNNPIQALEAVAFGQTIIEAKHNPDVVATKWKEVIESI